MTRPKGVPFQVERQFKRPSRVILYLARERYRLLDGLNIFACGVATGYGFSGEYVAMAVGVMLSVAGLIINHLIQMKMESYR